MTDAERKAHELAIAELNLAWRTKLVKVSHAVNELVDWISRELVDTEYLRVLKIRPPSDVLARITSACEEAAAK